MSVAEVSALTHPSPRVCEAPRSFRCARALGARCPSRALTVCSPETPEAVCALLVGNKTSFSCSSKPPGRKHQLCARLCSQPLTCITPKLHNVVR